MAWYNPLQDGVAWLGIPSTQKNSEGADYTGRVAAPSLHKVVTGVRQVKKLRAVQVRLPSTSVLYGTSYKLAVKCVRQ